MTGKEAAGPAAARDRIEAIDALRGFALLGILFANLPYWGGLVFASDAQRAAILGGISRDAYWTFFNGVLDGKFYTLFSILFGLGFTLQLDRLEKRGADGLAIFRRRMAALLLIGTLHMLLVWDGDILFLYAALGFALPLFRHLSMMKLVASALVFLFAVPILGVLLVAVTGVAPGLPLFMIGDAISGLFGITPQTNLVDYATEDGWAHWLGWQSSGWAYSYGDRLNSWRIFKVLGCMLLGMGAGRLLTRGRLLGNRRLLWSVLIGGAVIGVPPTIAYTHLPPHSQDALVSLIGTAPLGAAYGAAFLLAWPVAERVLAIFAPVGRMALTNYLTHSLACGIAAFGYGFGQMGKLTVLEIYGWGLALYGAQIIFSNLWLGRNRQGPMEAVWRYMTYGAPKAPLA